MISSIPFVTYLNWVADAFSPLNSLNKKMQGQNYSLHEIASDVQNTIKYYEINYTERSNNNEVSGSGEFNIGGINM